jgi:hypothetical protein
MVSVLTVVHVLTNMSDQKQTEFQVDNLTIEQIKLIHLALVNTRDLLIKVVGRKNVKEFYVLIDKFEPTKFVPIDRLKNG